MRSFGMIIGITGPSGSGKSLFCSMLAERGFTVLDCDKIYHDMISAHGECTAALAREFGNEILNAQGGIDRSALADRVFNSADALERLNSITRKHVVRRIEELAHSAEAAGDHVAVDAPTLFEAGADSICGMTVGILAPRRTRASRLAARDGNIRTEKQLRARLDASKPDSFYTDRCDITFRNDKGNDALEAFAEQISSGTYAKANKKGSAT